MMPGMPDLGALLQQAQQMQADMARRSPTWRSRRSPATPAAAW